MSPKVVTQSLEPTGIAMRRRVARLLVVIAAVLVLVLPQGQGHGQEKGKAGKKPAAQKNPADPKPAAKKPGPEEDEPSGRLPPYYKDVVDDKQRDQIYSIQAEYADRIERLKRQLAELEEQRDGRIEAVLTPQQKAKVEAARAEAKSKKAAKKSKQKLKLPGRS
jgi:hypothetical protein